LDLSPEQERLVELVDEFDKQMKEKYGDQGGSGYDEDSTPSGKKLDLEPKLGGLSIKNSSPFVKFLYFAGVIGIIALAVFFAFNKLFNPKLSVYD